MQQACRQLQRPSLASTTTLSRFFSRKLKFFGSYLSVLSVLLLGTKWKSLSVSSPEKVTGDWWPACSPAPPALPVAREKVLPSLKNKQDSVPTINYFLNLLTYSTAHYPPFNFYLASLVAALGGRCEATLPLLTEISLLATEPRPTRYPPCWPAPPPRLPATVPSSSPRLSSVLSPSCTCSRPRPPRRRAPTLPLLADTVSASLVRRLAWLPALLGG